MTETPMPDLELTIQDETNHKQETSQLAFEECEEFFDDTKVNNLELVEVASPEIKIRSSPPSSSTLSIFNCLYSLFFKD